MKPASTKCARGRFICRGGYRMLVGHDVQERQDVKSLMMRGLIAAVVTDLVDGAGWRVLDGTAHPGAGGGHLGGRKPDHARAICRNACRCAMPMTRFNTLAREINTMLDKIEATHARHAHGTRQRRARSAHPAESTAGHCRGRDAGLVPGSPERRVLERVTSEVDHMRSTLDALLRIALAETGTVAREPVDLSELVASVVELYAPASEERGIALNSSVAPGATVQGSRQLLAQALANLLDNAIKFTPDASHSGSSARFGQRS